MLLPGAGPKAVVRPFASGDSAGNLKLHVAGRRLVIRWVARQTGTLSKLWIKTRAVPADGSSYVGGTTANWSWLVKHHPVNQATGLFDPATVLATETFNPNTRQFADSGGIDGQAIGLVCGFSTTKGQMYATTLEPANASPAVDYASANFLYTTTGGEGAKTRNELDQDAADAYEGYDPRETLGGCLSDGTGQSYPANNFNYPGPFTKHDPTYIQVYSDGTAVGQPYYTGAQLAASTVQTMHYRFQRPTAITQLGAFFAAADTWTVVLAVNGTDRATVTLTSTGIGHQQKTISAVQVTPTDDVTVRTTPSVTGALHARYSDAIFRSVIGTQSATGPYYLESDNTRVAPLFALPWLPPYEPGFGATTAYTGVSGTLTASTASTTVVVTLASPIASGSRAVLLIAGRNSSATITAVTDTAGNIWTVDGTKTDTTANNFMAICSANMAAGLSATNTVTVTFNLSQPLGPSINAFVHELTGVKASAAVDLTANGSSISTLPSGTVGPTPNTAQAQEMIVAAFMFGSNPTSFTPGHGYTAMGGGILKTTGATSGDRSLAGAYLPVSVAGPQTASAAWTPSSNWSGLLVAYKGA